MTKAMAIKKHNYVLVEGLGGGDAPSFLLLLNGGMCKSWPKQNWTVQQARMGAKVHVDEWIGTLGEKNVTFQDQTQEEAASEAAPPQATPTDQLHDALIDKGYRRLARYGVTREDTVAFVLYTSSGQTLLLQEYKDGGCELYKPVSDSIKIQATIDAIPTL